MAHEPAAPITGAQFLNHVRSTLDASLQRWEFISAPHRGFKLPEWIVQVRFLGTGRVTRIIHDDDGTWSVQDENGHDAWLTGRLNGHTRDDAGHFTTELDSNGQPLMSDEVGR